MAVRIAAQITTMRARASSAKWASATKAAEADDAHRSAFSASDGAKIVTSQHPRRAQPPLIDAEIYKWRHLIENFFGKLKEFKRIAMRADKTDQSFSALIYLAGAVINSR